MRPFGCPYFIHVPKQLRKKLDAKSKAGIFIGYFEETKGYRLWIPEKQQVVTSRDVIFDEDKLLTQSTPPNKCSKPPISYLPVSLNMRTINPIQNPIGSTSEIPLAIIIPKHVEPQPIINLASTQPPADTQDDPYNINFSPRIPPLQLNPEQNNSSSSIAIPLGSRPKNPPNRYGEWYFGFSVMTATLPSVPKTYHEAVTGPFAEQWIQAMDEEFDSLLTNGTWRLTSLPAGRKTIKCKWVYALKTKPDSSLERFKARLVAKGCSQVPGVDFKQTYLPTVKYDSIRLILSLVASKDLEMRQFDIKIAFLYGSIDEEIYMQQVEGYEDPKNIQHVYILLKALYGLHQASLAWALKMDYFLKKFNLQQATVDHCVYYSNDNGIITIVTMFVDDGLICSTDLERIQSILRFMSDVFVTKITEPEMYIGLHLICDRLNRTITLDQALYI
jgi:hypothetical protein